MSETRRIFVSSINVWISFNTLKQLFSSDNKIYWYMFLMLWMDSSNFSLMNSGQVILFNFFQDFTFAFETEYNFLFAIFGASINSYY